ncbi:MAG: hypothetical protein AB7G80_02480 [Dongiaceae bacterium]
MRFWFFLFLLGSVLAACNRGNHSPEAGFCRAVVEDVFVSNQDLDIQEVAVNAKNPKGQVTVIYSVLDTTGRRVNDKAVCSFNPDLGAKGGLLSLHQLGADIPAIHVAFLNQRLGGKFGYRAPPLVSRKAAAPPAEAPKINPPPAPAPEAETPKPKDSSVPDDTPAPDMGD